ncbi:MAG: dTDP-4-dehydrorhamnose 3,5-epimerase [Bacteriovoracaceae bacterium]|nr:dTDP-4-dehydrorhamnose 3,5-epimerase [Bacteriovoracaceae bacterium]
MKFVPLEIPGLFCIEPKIFEDNRGYFFESFREDLFESSIGRVRFIQDNEALSYYGVFRGFHFQKAPKAQAKLVRVVEGRVLDVVVDLRQESKFFGKIASVELSDENKRQLFIPKGFAHGYLTLSKQARFQYKVDHYFSKEDEGGLIYSDPALRIDWPISLDEFKISEKDRILPGLSQLKNLKF